MLIRREGPADVDATRRIHTDAFAPAYLGADPVEPELLAQLRHDPGWIPELSVVAVVDDAVVGHVCCTRAHVGLDEHPVLGLGPIGVAPGRKRRGVGAALMHSVIGAADALDEPLIVLLGHPGYYPRFGFEPAVPLGIRPPVPEWEPAFQARRLTAYSPGLAGVFRYAAPFRAL